MPDVVRAVMGALDGLRDDLPFAFFGHSLGGRIAFEVARAMEADGRPAPRHVVLAASMDPSALDTSDRLCHELPDHAFEAYVAGFGGSPDQLRRYPRQYRAVMDLLRADMEVVATASEPVEPRLRAPLSILSGRDDPAVRESGLAGWAERAGGGFSRTSFAGGHFFPNERAAEVVAWLRALLAPAMRAA
jgi:surfactin synthase thioesterase subunit